VERFSAELLPSLPTIKQFGVFIEQNRTNKDKYNEVERPSASTERSTQTIFLKRINLAIQERANINNTQFTLSSTFAQRSSAELSF
jgi:hypothetical protein